MTARQLDDLKAALVRLERSEGRIARRNARRAFFGAIRSLRSAVDRSFPAIDKPAAKPNPHARIVGKTWRQVEYANVKAGGCPWSRARAEEFNAYVSEVDEHPAKPIRFDLPEGGRLLGQHAGDAIRILPLPLLSPTRDADQWRTLIHEIAHYRARGHGRAFKVELLRIYGLWRAWRAGGLPEA